MIRFLEIMLLRMFVQFFIFVIAGLTRNLTGVFICPNEVPHKSGMTENYQRRKSNSALIYNKWYRAHYRVTVKNLYSRKGV